MVIAGIMEFILGNTYPCVVSCGFGEFQPPDNQFNKNYKFRNFQKIPPSWSNYNIGGFWFTMGATMTPGFGAYAAYSPDPSQPTLGLTTPGFLASFGIIPSISLITFQTFSSHFIPALTAKPRFWALLTPYSIIAWFFMCMAIFSFIGFLCALRTNMVNVVIFLFLAIQYSILASSNWAKADGDDGRAYRTQIVRFSFFPFAIHFPIPSCSFQTISPCQSLLGTIKKTS